MCVQDRCLLLLKRGAKDALLLIILMQLETGMLSGVENSPLCLMEGSHGLFKRVETREML